ncbi:MAG: sodium:proton exchanger [Candidatus Coatesbacteria bacterium]
MERTKPKGHWFGYLGLAMAFAVPALALRFAGYDPGPLPSVLIFGGAVCAAAFLLVWAAEAAEKDISSSLAVALLALIAVMPEYAVDLYFAWAAGGNPTYTQYAAANMTGSNRLLLGFGWPVAALVYFFYSRRAGHPVSAIHLEGKARIELAFLGLASVWCFIIPLMRRITVWDAAVLLGIFAAYIWRVTREPQHEPELVGTAALLGALPTRMRRAVVTSLFVLAAIFILVSAEPFAESLIEAGKILHIDEFLLVQWLAPLASEAPEFIVAIILAARLRGGHAIGILLSSKVNQWTLLIGSLPLAYVAGGGPASGLELDARQVEEVFLTASQTVLGFAVLAHLHFGFGEALALLVLFLVQFALPGTEGRVVLSWVYLALAVVLLWRHRRSLPAIVDAVVRPGKRIGRIRYH